MTKGLSRVPSPEIGFDGWSLLKTSSGSSPTLAASSTIFSYPTARASSLGMGLSLPPEKLKASFQYNEQHIKQMTDYVWTRVKQDYNFKLATKKWTENII